MVKHFVMWHMKDEYAPEKKSEYLKQIKEGLEGLVGVIPGMVSAKVYTLPLEGQAFDMMLDSTFSDEEALKNYQSNPAHIKVATIVRSVVDGRACFDCND